MCKIITWNCFKIIFLFTVFYLRLHIIEYIYDCLLMCPQIRAIKTKIRSLRRISSRRTADWLITYFVNLTVNLLFKTLQLRSFHCFLTFFRHIFAGLAFRKNIYTGYRMLSNFQAYCRRDRGNESEVRNLIFTKHYRIFQVLNQLQQKVNNIYVIHYLYSKYTSFQRFSTSRRRSLR